MENIDTNLIKETLETFKETFDNPIQLQIFKTSVYKGDFKEAIERHKIEIIITIGTKYEEIMSANL